MKAVAHRKIAALDGNRTPAVQPAAQSPYALLLLVDMAGTAQATAAQRIKTTDGKESILTCYPVANIDFSLVTNKLLVYFLSLSILNEANGDM